MKGFEKVVKILEEDFQEPQYLDVKIRYVKTKEEADVYVSEDHILDDYIVLGTFALFNSVVTRKNELKVFSQKKLNKKKIGIWTDDTYKEILVDSKFFFQMNDPLNIIYDRLYRGNFKVMGIGMIISASLMIQLADEDATPKELMDELIFKNFDDTMTAQKNVFILIKKMSTTVIANMIAATLAGMLF